MARVRTVRIVVIGGGRNVGSFLVPRLVRAGPEVVNLTRGAPRSLRLQPGVVGGRSDPSGPGGRDVGEPGWFGQTGRTRSVSWPSSGPAPPRSTPTPAGNSSSAASTPRSRRPARARPAPAPLPRHRHRRRQLPHETSPRQRRNQDQQPLRNTRRLGTFTWPPAGTTNWPLTSCGFEKPIQIDRASLESRREPARSRYPQLRSWPIRARSSAESEGV